MQTDITLTPPSAEHHHHHWPFLIDLVNTVFVFLSNLEFYSWFSCVNICSVGVFHSYFFISVISAIYISEERVGLKCVSHHLWNRKSFSCWANGRPFLSSTSPPSLLYSMWRRFIFFLEAIVTPRCSESHSVFSWRKAGPLLCRFPHSLVLPRLIDLWDRVSSNIAPSFLPFSHLSLSLSCKSRQLDLVASNMSPFWIPACELPWPLHFCVLILFVFSDPCQALKFSFFYLPSVCDLCESACSVFLKWPSDGTARRIA